MDIGPLVENVNNHKENFIFAVNRLNYCVKLMKETPELLGDSTLTNTVKELVKSYEDYVNSKIEFTDKYFQQKFK